MKGIIYLVATGFVIAIASGTGAQADGPGGDSRAVYLKGWHGMGGGMGSGGMGGGGMMGSGQGIITLKLVGGQPKTQSDFLVGVLMIISTFQMTL